MPQKYRRIVLVLLLVVLACSPVVALANSAEPPGLIVAVTAPPEDLTLSLEFTREVAQPITLEAEKKAWVTYYRFFYHTMIEAGISGDKNMKNTALIAETNGEVLRFDLPAETFSRYNNFLELDLKRGELLIGENPWRTPLLVALRVVLTLLIEGAVFLLFGYRSKRTWITFFACNIVTQTVLNAMITGPELGYWFLIYGLMEILIFIAESAAIGSIVKEKKWSTTVPCVILANALSLVLGGWLITCLPV